MLIVQIFLKFNFLLMRYFANIWKWSGNEECCVLITILPDTAIVVLQAPLTNSVELSTTQEATSCAATP
jgi:hypothetical protein